MRYFLLATLFAVSATTANAALIGAPTVSQRDIAAAPAGSVVNVLAIDFDEQLFGQQLVVELTAGSIFQQAAFGTETAPNAGLIPVFADVEADTFVTIGGLTSASSQSVLVVGGTTELGMNAPKKFDTEGINVAWAPAPGVVVPSGAAFPIAQVTLSGDAQGAAFLFSNSGGQGQIFEGTIVDGAISFGIPEPSTVLLAGLALVGFVARRS